MRLTRPLVPVLVAAAGLAAPLALAPTAHAAAATCAGVFRRGHHATASARAAAAARSTGLRKSSDGASPQMLKGELRDAW